MTERDPPPHVVERESPGYPPALLALPDAPAGLEVEGVLPVGRAVAVVGTRAATPYGRAVATRLGRELAGLGITVVSGLARGIDAAAHLGALEVGGPTVAVLPFGVAPVLPSSHAALAARIATCGAVVAEWPLPSGFHPALFLHRNRLIAGLAAVTVVVEAGMRSGALSTARFARSLGRPCLAVPGDVDRPGSRGPHALLRAGARPCEGVADVLEAMERGESATPNTARTPRSRSAPKRRAPRPAQTTAAGSLLEALDVAGATVDTIARRMGWDVPRTLAELLPLEWAGVVERRPGARWGRRRSGAA